MPCSKDPVKVQVLVGPDKSLGAFALSTIQRLPRQAQEALQAIPSEISPSPHGETFRHSDKFLINAVRMGGGKRPGALT